MCSLFGVLTSTQITEIENANGEELKDDKIFNKCINQAKNTAAIREKTYKDALVAETKRNETNHSGNSQPTPVSFTQTRVSQGRVVQTTNAQRTFPPRANTQAVGSNRGTLMSSAGAGQRERDNSWLQVLDSNRKYNLILFRINDTNNKNEDNIIVEGMMRAIGCASRIAEKTNIIRLGAKRNGKCRPLMVCFSNVNAVNQVLARSPNLSRSGIYGHIYVKRDLPRDQRPSANKRDQNVFAEAGLGGGGPSVAPAARDPRVHSGDAGDDENELSDIVSESDFPDTDEDRSSDDDDDDTLVPSDAVSSSEEDGEASRNGEVGECSQRIPVQGVWSGGSRWCWPGGGRLTSRQDRYERFGHDPTGTAGQGRC